jgi:hypothetical protein
VLVTRDLPEELATEDVQSPTWDGYLPIDGKVGLGEANRQQRIIVFHSRSEEQGAASPRPQDEEGEEPRPLVVEL